jgi:hypothetical protein
MSKQTHWRLALMFNAPDGDLAGLEVGMEKAKGAIRTAAAPHPVRLGIADRDPDLYAGDDVFDAVADWRPVEGAVEVTVANDSVGNLAEISRSLQPLLAEFADLSTVEIMAGPIFPMVPDRQGTAFLSLAFRRYPGTTSQEFQNWWMNQHSRIATPVLEPELLAYDQVHVDQAASQSAAEAFGVPYVEYDAYDNLTWQDRRAFVNSCTKDLEGMARIAADEIGRIDNSSRRHALMREIS